MSWYTETNGENLIEDPMTDDAPVDPPDQDQAEGSPGGQRVVIRPLGINVIGFLCGGICSFSMVALGVPSFLAVIVPPIAAQFYIVCEGRQKELARGVLFWGLAEFGACLFVGLT